MELKKKEPSNSNISNIIYLFSYFFFRFTISHYRQVRGYLRLNSMLDPDTDTEEPVEIFNKTLNLCQVMVSKKIAPILRVLITEIAKSGTMFTACPIEKKHYYLQNFRIDEENLPSYLPETDFLVEIYVFSDQKSGKSVKYFSIILNGRIDKSKSLDDFKLFTMG